MAMLLVMTGWIVAIAVYEHRHPCLRYSVHRVLVPELTTYMTLDAERGLMMPMTTPEHFEEETVCEERRQ
jgi:hypothetical protein